METHKEEWEKELDRWLHDEAVLTKLKIQQLLTHQKQTIMDMCEEMRAEEEYVNLERADDPSYTQGEEYNQALSDLKERIAKL